VKTAYSGRATVGEFAVDIDIGNVDLPGWTGTASNARQSATVPTEAIVTLLEQPRPGWSARAHATQEPDGAWHLDGLTRFCAPEPPPAFSSGRPSLWVRKPLRGA
jgi:hypothetical protein